MNSKHMDANVLDVLELDGAPGEGGGQVLRTALSLSMITGRPFFMVNVRARRAKPGLLRQHLTAVEAAAQICGAKVEGAALGSQSLHFAPGAIRGGDYRFAIGTAGSSTLVLQTVLPALWYADTASTVTVTGGTHNKAAPPADFLARAWLPLMRHMGLVMELELVRHGFYPAGGGVIIARVEPGVPRPLALERGERMGMQARALVAGIPETVGRRELATLRQRLGDLPGEVVVLAQREGPGNAVMVDVTHSGLTEIFTGFGERGVAAETVAGRVADEVEAYLASGAAIGEHLADQLVLPMALAGGGRFTAAACSSHLLTNLAVIRKFVPLDAKVTARAGHWLVEFVPTSP